MAARLNPKTAQFVREKIQATQLVNLLQKEALGKVQLKDGQRDSARYLLNHAIGMAPQANDVTINGQIAHNDITDKPISAEQWAATAEDYMGTATRPAEAPN
jgi:predicted transcriptional regulator